MFAGTVAVYGALQLVLAFSISALYSPVDAGVYFLALAIVTPSALFVGFRLRDDLLVIDRRSGDAGWSDFAVCLGVLAFKSSELVADIAKLR